MTLLHFVNLSALTLVPQFLVYKVLLCALDLPVSVLSSHSERIVAMSTASIGPCLCSQRAYIWVQPY